MVLQEKIGVRSVRVALAVLAGTALLAGSAAAQEAIQKVEITGSSIKRIAVEGALPVQRITQEQIAKTGAATVADLMQALPAMQGFSIAATAAGSDSGGIATASIHNIGEDYTLVLLDGRRIAPTGSGTTINLNSIPMSAIDRIEVLTDGASALYGSDAIAGVVNFVMKRHAPGGNVTASGSRADGGKGNSAYASLTYGLGDFDKDRFTLVASYRHDEQKKLSSGDRDFSKSAYLPFTFGGKSYIYDRTSTSADPANAQVTFTTASALSSYSFSPYRKANGNNCAPNNVYSLNNTIAATNTTATAGTAMCAFDYVTTIDVYPESSRDSLFLSGEFKLSESAKLFSDIAFTRLDLIARIAPNPVPVAISTSSSLYTTYVKPYLTTAQQAGVNQVTALYRATDFGPRTSETVTDAKHIVFGGELNAGGWDLSSGLTWSQNKLDESYTNGYMKKAEFTSLIAAGSLDPFVPSGHQSAATKTLIDASIYHGSVRTAATTLTAADVRGSRELFNLDGGMAMVGIGADVAQYHYVQTPSADAVAGVIYNFAANPAYDLKRGNYGAFAELQLPLIKKLDLTASLRYDSFDSVKDALKNKDVGEKLSSNTYKVSAKYALTNTFMLRGSYGTGFKAPAMLDLAQPIVSNGVTAAAYDCPYTGNALCKPGKQQYSQLSGGNPNLKPEKSKQATFGMRIEPSADFTMAADYWSVKMSDAISAVSPNQGFADVILNKAASPYASLFRTYRTPAETQDYYAFLSSSTNIGHTRNSGVDWEFTARTNLNGIGRLSYGMNGTYMIESSYTRPGTANDYTDSMSHYGENAAVTFRNIFNAVVKLETGAFSNGLIFSRRSAYTDQNQTVRDVATNVNVKVAIDVPAYMTIDYQGAWKYNKALELRLGIKNLTNRQPPFTLRDSSGHQVGYDPRYASPLLRTIYVTGSYNF